MVTAGILFVLLAELGSATPADAVAVVRFAKGRAIASEDGASRSIAPGSLLAAGAVVEVGRAGWAELQLAADARLRLAAETRLVVERSRLRLLGGRAWIEHPGGEPLAVELPDGSLRIAPRTSVIVEHTRAAGSAVAVASGAAFLEARAGGEVRVDAHQVSMIAPGAAAASPARRGGRGIIDLASQASEGALGDLAGVRAFLIERASRAKMRAADPRGGGPIVRFDAEVAGADGGPAGAAAEAAVRAPPFFEDEVPPKGPNVQVDVTFAE